MHKNVDAYWRRLEAELDIFTDDLKPLHAKLQDSAVKIRWVFRQFIGGYLEQDIEHL